MKADKPVSAAASTTWVVKLSASGGIVAATVLVVLVNVFVARHYTRWDFTKGGLYTLSDGTKETLHALEQPVKVFVLMPARDPLAVSALRVLDMYRGETTRLDVELTDPDRHAAEFLAVQQRYGVVAGKTEDGRIVTDAPIIVVGADRPYFIAQKDLVEVDDADDLRARPRLEQALTSAIRSVTAKDQPVACFSTGHGEAKSDAGGSGASALRDRLVKSNFVVRTVGPIKAEHDEPSSLDGCRLLVIAGPEERFAPEDVARFVAYVEKGGSALVAAGPQPDSQHEGYLKLGLDPLVALAGVKLDDDFVFELDPGARSARGYGETFSPKPKPHAVTQGLVKAADRAPPVVLTIASSLSKTGASVAVPVPLLETSEQAFGMSDFFAWAKNTPPPSAGPADKKGPLVVAYAAELAKPAGTSEAHGARLVVIGSASPIMSANWSNEELRGTAIFVDSAVGWLAARPMLVDIPNKPSFATGLHVSDEQLAALTRQVLIYLPATAVLLGVAVRLRRRAEKRDAKPKSEGSTRDRAKSGKPPSPPGSP